MRETFAVGRVGKKSREVVWTRAGARRDPFPGPWSVRAVVGPREPEEPAPATPDRAEEPTPAPAAVPAPRRSATEADGADRPQLDLFG